MLHSGCVKLHQKFRDFVGLPMGLLREESLKNRMNTGLFGSRSGSTASKPLVAHRSSASDNRQLQNAKKARKYAIFRAFSIPKILSGLFGFDGI